MSAPVRLRVPSSLDGVTMLAVSLWLGGLVVLGTVVAPTVFRNVPPPYGADAMTLVFRRFDRIAMAAGVIGTVAEVVRLVRARRTSRAGTTSMAWLDWARGAMITAAATLALAQGLSLSPTIEGLHRSGAVRGVGAQGQALDVVHHWAERSGKAQVGLLLAYLIVFSLNAARPQPVERPTRSD